MAVVAVLATAGVVSCSLFTDLDSLSGGGGQDGGADATSSSTEAGASEAGAVDAGSDARDAAVAELPDANLPPPPPTCKKTGLTCVPAAPSGWAGPFALYSGSVSDAPACAAGLTSVLTANDALAPPAPASCSACACANATGFTCGGITVTGNNGACNCTTGNSSSFALNTCYQVSYGSFLCDSYNADWLRIAPKPAAGGGCTPVAAKPTVTKPPVSWGTAAVGCQLSVASQVDCPSGDVCVATSSPPFSPGLCVMKAGDLPACPGFPYTQRSVFYRSVSDSRDCAACGCGAPPATTCPTKVKSAAQGDCSDQPYVDAPACVDWASFHNVSATATQPTDVKCPPTGGTAIGTATAADPVTVCCAAQ